MTSGTVAATLLLLACGLALAFAPRRAAGPSLLALIAAFATAIFLPLPRARPEPLFFGCWISVIATAASVHLRAGVSTRVAAMVSLNAGAWAGAVGMLSASRLETLEVLPAVLLFLPARCVAMHRGAVVVKVLASWIIAIAALAAALQLLPVTVGYLPDHLE